MNSAIQRPPRPYFLIGYAGPAGCGKDTLAGVMREVYGGGVYDMTGPLRDMARVGLGLHLDSREAKDGMTGFNKTGREILQTLGTDWARNMIDPDIWVKVAHERLNHEPPGVWHLPSIRFENEATWVRKHGIMIHIERPDNPDATVHSDHASEDGVEFKPGDWRVVNNKSIQDLYDFARDYRIERLIP